jgi:hypothetical protein
MLSLVRGFARRLEEFFQDAHGRLGGIHSHTMARKKQGARAACYGTGSCFRTGGSTGTISDSIPK